MPVYTPPVKRTPRVHEPDATTVSRDTTLPSSFFVVILNLIQDLVFNLVISNNNSERARNLHISVIPECPYRKSILCLSTPLGKRLVTA